MDKPPFSLVEREGMEFFNAAQTGVTSWPLHGKWNKKERKKEREREREREREGERGYVEPKRAMG
jgi:hypothetical protein